MYVLLYVLWNVYGETRLKFSNIYVLWNHEVTDLSTWVDEISSDYITNKNRYCEKAPSRHKYTLQIQSVVNRTVLRQI